MTLPEGRHRSLAWLGAALVLCLSPHWAPALFGALPLVLYFPGRALAIHLEPDRPGAALRRTTLACGLSLAITPVALRLAGLLFPFGKAMVLGVLGGFSLILILASLRRDRRHVPRSAAVPAGWGVATFLILTAALLAPTLWIGTQPTGGETRTKGWDLHNHQSVSEAIVYGGLPPTNPFIKSSSPFYYHTYFHLVDAGVQALCGARAPAYLITALLTLAAALLFLAVFYFVLAELSGRPRGALWALLPVSLAGGYDLLPTLVRIFNSGEVADWNEMVARRWNVDAWISHQKIFIPGLFAQFYWAPHAVSAVTVFLLALYFLETDGVGERAYAGAGICLAAMAGFNGYVALGGVVTLALLRGPAFLEWGLGRHDRAPAIRRSLLAGITALALAAPVVNLYFGARSDVEKFRFAGAGPLLPAQLMIDFGPALILGLAGALIARRHPELRRGLLPFLLMGGPALVMICLVASTGENNDLSMRNSMFVWIALAALSGLSLEAAWKSRLGRRAALLVLLPGLLGTLWFSFGASWDKPVLDADEVAAGRWVRSHLPRGVTVQASPLRNSPELVYLSGHPAILSDSWAARLFYSNPADFDRNLKELLAIFSSEDPALSCPGLAHLGVGALVVGPPETGDFPILARPLPWSCLEPAFEHGEYRVFRVLH
ncbi:MAG TPA: hypothetical protein VFW45_06315 [Candidatus Polarisedimenticolia bacterium]|nr:hypothetical protein [Candidatus Polarisedimenticolia bacterium]